MISVSHMTKHFAGCMAVNDVSFEVESGEIVGFLGPNGAGKTTTMRILAGYLPASSGRITVAGYDVFTQSLEVRRRIGYMPENVPLYPDMRVDEYLDFRARLKGVRPSRRRHRLEEVKELCGLRDVSRRIIGQLSKGYRQRVGLAESMVNDPELLILDEPTLGLDPNQIRQVRELIKSLAVRHTILMSTHILSEAELTCQRVLIINQGRIVASDSPEMLRRHLQGAVQVVVEIQGRQDEVLTALQSLPGVENVNVQAGDPWPCYTLACAESADDVRPAIYEQAVKHQWRIRELRAEKKTLEDVFVSLTTGENGGRAG